MDSTAIENKKSAILAKVWSNKEFKRQFAADPKGIIASEFGLDFPPGVNVKVLFDTPDIEHLVLIPPELVVMEEEPSVKTALNVKAWKDPAFKAALLADAKAAFRDFYKHPLPDKPALKVVEQTVDTLYMVIPERPQNLSDAELDQVAGGGDTLEYVAYGVLVGGSAIAGPGAVLRSMDTILRSDSDLMKKIGPVGRTVVQTFRDAPKNLVHTIFHTRW